MASKYAEAFFQERDVLVLLEHLLAETGELGAFRCSQPLITGRSCCFDPVAFGGGPAAEQTFESSTIKFVWRWAGRNTVAMPGDEPGTEEHVRSREGAQTMGSNDFAAQIGSWLRDGMLAGNPLAIAAAAILAPLGMILGSTTL
ncbi:MULTISPECIES: hypothetical protein [Prescottella]|uniref:hypothetical protein n=1 Tax=Prescottella TaxID=2979332 RepID=UPI000A0F53B2|nr:hypothetical protein [Prescottella equi]NKS79345.1 hypothetical protein [Prescottella equi]ORL34297.1 hypothetical protein A6I87_16905 [Prescottella equi]ORL92476.1 hypothetical protein A5N69_19790 [Prescottella equi]ORM08421.1 hypothetical protein A5N77_20340 [Prescottella equi]ORM15113.1 hypothetical protein A5N74_22280 [Prescottella equi]